MKYHHYCYCDLYYELVLHILVDTTPGSIDPIFANSWRNVLKDSGSLEKISKHENTFTFLLNLMPDTDLPKLINSFKTISSRKLKKTYEIKDGGVWNRGYYIRTIESPTINNDKPQWLKAIEKINKG